MSAKDYKALARAFKRERPAKSWLNKMVQWRADLAAVADELAADNPRFDRDRFIAAACE
jgi:hypothetical protein